MLSARLARGALRPRRRPHATSSSARSPGDSSWWHTLGSATLTAFLVQLVDRRDPRDVLQARPRDGARIDRAHHATTSAGGWLVRGMHRWGASVFIILMFLHMARVFLFGAYKYPRELNWIVGVLILATGLLRGPHRLPAARSTRPRTGRRWSAININGTAPVRRPVPGERSCAAGPRSAGHARPASTRCTCCSSRGADRSDRRCTSTSSSASASPRRRGRRTSRRRRARRAEPPPTRSGLVQPGPRPAGVRRRPVRVSSLDERRAGSSAYKEDVKKRASRSTRSRCSTTR